MTRRHQSEPPRSALDEFDPAAPHVWEDAEDGTAKIRQAVEKLKSKGLIKAPADRAVLDKTAGDAAAQLCSVKSRWRDVTPAMAEDWLRNNFRNRPVSQDVVAAYARDMVNGVWIPTHQGIAFNARDELIDGQHRLLAIVKAGKTIRMMVTYNLPCEIEGSEMTTMDAVDRGRTRSVADQLKIQHGMPHGTVIAAITRTLGMLCHDARTRRLSVGQTLEIYRAFQEPIDWLIERRPRKAKGLSSTGVMAGFAFALAGTEASRHQGIQQSFLDLISGTFRPPHSALRLLHSFLTGDAAALLMRGTDRGVAELVLQALLHEERGDRIERLELKQEGYEHYRALQPERVERIASIFRLPAEGTEASRHRGIKA